MSFFVFRLNKLKIIKNREIGPADVKVLSFLTVDNIALPDLDQLVKTDEAAERKALTQIAVQSVLNAKVLMEVEHVKDDQVLTFGDTGYALYTSQTIPQSFNWSLLVLASGRTLQFWEEQVNNVLNDPKFGNFAEDLVSVLKVAMNPAMTAGLTISKFILDKTTGMMKQNNAQQIGVLYQSFDRYEHYPQGERSVSEEPDLTNNMFIDYSIFGVEDQAAAVKE